MQDIGARKQIVAPPCGSTLHVTPSQCASQMYGKGKQHASVPRFSAQTDGHNSRMPSSTWVSPPLAPHPQLFGGELKCIAPRVAEIGEQLRCGCNAQTLHLSILSRRRPEVLLRRARACLGKQRCHSVEGGTAPSSHNNTHIAPQARCSSSSSAAPRTCGRQSGQSRGRHRGTAASYHMLHRPKAQRQWRTPNVRKAKWSKPRQASGYCCQL